MCKFCSQHKAQVYKNKSLKTLSHNLWAQIEIALRLWKQLLKSTKKGFLLKPISNKPREGWEQKIKKMASNSFQSKR